MTQENQINKNSQQGNVGLYQQPYQDDEIDLRELIKVIWDYKWLTVVMCTIAIVGSGFYALNAQEWWVAKGKVLKPELNDVVVLYSQSKNVGAILNASTNKDNKNDIKDFVSLFEPNTLFKMFTDSFNSSLNKKLFLEENNFFLEYLSSKEIQVPSDELSAENQLLRGAYRVVLNSWMKDISASLDAKSGELVLLFRTPEKNASALLLNEYISFISKEVKDNQLEKFMLFVDSSKQELSISIDITKKRVKQQLAGMLKKTEYAYQIASQAELVNYKASLNIEEELFQINLGEKALKAKVAVLKSMTDLSLLDPTISEKQITLDALNQFEFVDDRAFTPFRYLEVVEPPLTRAAPKRALIVVLATLLAGMLSIFFALVHHFMTKKDDE
jgi:chain length determinant protein (polysaccharide antigen chain regulator)